MRVNVCMYVYVYLCVCVEERPWAEGTTAFWANGQEHAFGILPTSGPFQVLSNYRPAMHICTFIHKTHTQKYIHTHTHAHLHIEEPCTHVHERKGDTCIHFRIYTHLRKYSQTFCFVFQRGGNERK